MSNRIRVLVGSQKSIRKDGNYGGKKKSKRQELVLRRRILLFLENHQEQSVIHSFSEERRVAQGSELVNETGEIVLDIWAIFIQVELEGLAFPDVLYIYGESRPYRINDSLSVFQSPRLQRSGGTQNVKPTLL